MTKGPKLKKLLKRYSLPEDATHEEVLRALNVQCAGPENDRDSLYSKKCQTWTDPEDLGPGYD